MEGVLYCLNLKLCLNLSMHFRVTSRSLVKFKTSLCNISQQQFPVTADFLSQRAPSYKQKIQVISCNQVYFSSSKVLTDTTVIVKD